MQAFSQCDGLVLCAAAGAAAGDADLQQDLEQQAARMPFGPGFDQRELGRRIDEEGDAQVGMLAAQHLDDSQVGVGQHLVGDQRAARAGSHTDGQLVHGGKRQAPGAGVELARKELRRHRGLAVRRQVYAPLPRLRLHPGQVVCQCLAFEQRQRQRQVAGQHVPAGLADLAAPQCGMVERKTLEAGADERVEQVHRVHARAWISRSLRIQAE